MNIEIANRLVTLRKNNGFSQEELADKLGISRQAVSKWERAESSPDTDNLIALARLYNVSLDELLSLGDESTENESFVSPEYSEALSGKRKRRFWNAFPYPVIVVIVYLLLGMVGGWWHPGWLVFLTIPVFYGIVENLES